MRSKYLAKEGKGNRWRKRGIIILQFNQQHLICYSAIKELDVAYAHPSTCFEWPHWRSKKSRKGDLTAVKMFSGAQFPACKTVGWQPSAKIALVCLYRVSGSSSPLLFFATLQYFHGGYLRVSKIFPCQEYFHVRNIFMSGIFLWWKYEFVRNNIFRALLSIKCTAMFCQ